MLNCAKFVTTTDYAPRLRAPLAIEQQLIDDATTRGWTREAERHQATRARLEQLLAELGPAANPCERRMPLPVDMGHRT